VIRNRKFKYSVDYINKAGRREEGRSEVEVEVDENDEIYARALGSAGRR